VNTPAATRAVRIAIDRYLVITNACFGRSVRHERLPSRQQFATREDIPKDSKVGWKAAAKTADSLVAARAWKTPWLVTVLAG
jgi:hypothetical protein